MAAPPALASLTFNSLADVERRLPAQARVAEALGVRLAVADNASTDGTLERLRELARELPALELVELERNLGFAAGANRAIEAAGSADVLLLNPDVELEGEAGARAVRELAEMLASHPRAGVLAPCLDYEDGEEQPSARRSPDPLAYLGSLPRLERFGPLRRRYERFTAPVRAEEPAPVDWVIGAAMLIRRSAFEQVGRFDEGFFLYLEDADLCMRMWARGWRVLQTRRVRLVHSYKRRSQAEHGGVVASEERRHHVRSILRLFRRHPRMIVGRSRPASGGRP